MATQQTATVSITNETDGTAHIQLFHENSSNGTQNASWTAAPGETVGPLTVRFETGWGSFGILDWWAVVMAVEGGSTPGIYQNTGTSAVPNWKECQLQHGDAGESMTFSVSSSTFDVNLNSGGCSDAMKRLSEFNKITNVFVVMLENHSFDNVFGQSGIAGITHATSADTNSYNGSSYAVGSPAPLSMPTDPGHEFADTLEQLCGPGATYAPGGSYPPITNAGFVANYATTTDEETGLPKPGEIGEVMLGFDTPSQMPVMYQLATEFAICDHWFCSLPGPTFPNRFFLHGASSAGLDHSPPTSEIVKWETVDGFSYPKGSIYDALSAAGVGWRLYIDDTDAYSDDPQNGSMFGGLAQVSCIAGIHHAEINSLTHFASDLQGPYSSQYTFIEPNYGDVTGNTYVGGSSQHPMDDVYGGEGLLKAVYEAIRSSPLWNTSLLIVTYDEHGGFYDSVAPPPAPAPNDGSPSTLNWTGFTFEQYGIRVPTVLVSPLIKPGTVDSTVYDHSSVPKTLEQLFGFGSLTDRDAAASSVLGVLSEDAPRDDAPTALTDRAPAVASEKPTPEVLAAQDDDPIRLSGNLPGFLGAALKAEIEFDEGNEAKRASLIAEYESISTRGDARRLLARAAAKVAAARSGGPPAGAPRTT